MFTVWMDIFTSLKMGCTPPVEVGEWRFWELLSVDGGCIDLYISGRTLEMEASGLRRRRGVYIRRRLENNFIIPMATTWIKRCSMWLLVCPIPLLSICGEDR